MFFSKEIIHQYGLNGGIGGRGGLCGGTNGRFGLLLNNSLNTSILIKSFSTGFPCLVSPRVSGSRAFGFLTSPFFRTGLAVFAEGWLLSGSMF